MPLTIYDRTGKEVGKYDIDPTDLAPRINKQLLHDVVVMYQSNQRQGTAQTKSRGMVAGTTKKMYRQKGTGNARAGSRRSGIRRGGGHIFHKMPRDWSYRLPRKALQLATRMALASKIRDSQVTVIDDLKFDAPKTRDMTAILSALKWKGETLLVATAAHDANIYKSIRNIADVDVSPVGDLNAYTILTPRRLLITRAALDKMKEQAAAVGKGASDKGTSGKAETKKEPRRPAAKSKRPKAAST
jgi:large subunit ribosomal protein L4